MPTAPFACCASHPAGLVADIHHIHPTGWGGPDTAANKTRICPNTHRMGHTLLNRYKRDEEVPPWEFRRTFTKAARRVAQDGWERLLASRAAQASQGQVRTLVPLSDLPDL